MTQASSGSPRYVLLAHDHFTVHQAKTACSVLRFRPEATVAVLDRKNAGKTCRQAIGFGGDVPVVASLREAIERGANHMVIGIANPGGVFPPTWRAWILEAVHAGLDVSNGLHAFLSADEEIAAAARERGTRLIDLRDVPKDLTTPNGSRETLRVPVVLAVGSDCSVGKMTAMLEILDDARREGRKYAFVPTGQTGILIDGEGVAVDRVISDFVAGAIERYVVRAAHDSEFVLVEGQGSLLHPFYSGVTLGLLHGTQPDAMILCHEWGRHRIRHAHHEVPIPPMRELARIYEQVAGWVRTSVTIGIAVATHLEPDDDAARSILAGIAEETDLPVEDPVRFPDGTLYRACERYRQEFA